MWQEELKEYITLTGKQEMSIFFQDERKLVKLLNLYTTNFNANMLDNLLELMNYDHINCRFTLEQLEKLYDLCISQKERDFFMRCVDIMAYGSHIFRGLKNYGFEHPLFQMDDASKQMIVSFENCLGYIDELSDSVDENLQERLIQVTNRLIYPMGTLLSSVYQDTFLPQVKRAIDQCNQKEMLRLFRKYISKKNLYLQGLQSSNDVLEQILPELEEWIDEEEPEYSIVSIIYALENEVDIYQNNSENYYKQKELFDRYRNIHN